MRPPLSARVSSVLVDVDRDGSRLTFPSRRRAGGPLGNLQKNAPTKMDEICTTEAGRREQHELKTRGEPACVLCVVSNNSESCPKQLGGKSIAYVFKRFCLYMHTRIHIFTNKYMKNSYSKVDTSYVWSYTFSHKVQPEISGFLEREIKRVVDVVTA